MILWLGYFVFVAIVLAASRAIANRFWLKGRKIEKTTGVDGLYTYGLPLIAIAACTPLVWTSWATQGHFKVMSQNWLVLGTWLTGILTPASLLLAFWGIRAQSIVSEKQIKTADDQIKLIDRQLAVQQRANEIAAAALFNTMIETYNSNLNQLAGLVMEELSGSRNVPWGKIEGISMLALQLEQKAIGPLKASAYSLDRIRSRESYNRFVNELNRILDLAKQHDSTALIEYRIVAIRKLTDENPPL